MIETDDVYNVARRIMVIQSRLQPKLYKDYHLKKIIINWGKCSEDHKNQHLLAASLTVFSTMKTERGN